MRYILLIFFIILRFAGYTQVNAGDPQTICVGDQTTLEGSGPPQYTYLWTSVPNDPTISDPTSLTPTVQPSITTVYTLEGRDVSFQNLVLNGNFETGDNTGITSSYIYMPGPSGSIYNEGTYAITTDAGNNHPNFNCDEDHTTGNGYFMAVNGSSSANVVVWSQNINIIPNTEYEFSTWVMSLSPTSPAILQFRINGVLLGDPFQASAITCQWNMFFEQWNSGTATTAEISIVNQNTAGNGNDFALDDINFSKVTYFYDDCTVTVNPIPTSDFDIPAESCSSDTVMVEFNGIASPTATYNWDFDGATVLSGTGPGPYDLIWVNEGQKSVSLFVDDACISPTTTHTIDILQSPLVNVSASPSSIIWGTTTTLHGSMTGNSGQLIFEWDPEDSIQNPNHLHPDTKPLHVTTLFTFTSINNTNGCSAWDTVTVFVTGGPLAILSVNATNDTLCLSDSTNISVDISGGSGPVVSHWRSEPPGYNLTTSETTITVNPTETTTYYVYADDGYNPTPETSIQIVVLPQIEIVEQPSDTLVAVTQSAIFTVEANNNTDFQWQVSEDNGLTWIDLVDNTTYSGSQTHQLTVSDVGYDMNGFLYRCLLSGDCDPLISDFGVLNLFDTSVMVGILDDVDACQNDTIYVPCHISNFIEIDSFSLDFTYDTTLLDFSFLEILQSDLLSTQTSHNNDSINLNWYSTSGTTISDGIFFRFGFVAKSGGQDSLLWLSTSIVRNSYGINPQLEVNSANIVITSLPVSPDTVIAFPDSLNILDDIEIELEVLGGEGFELFWSADSCGGSSIGTDSIIVVEMPERTTTYFARWTNHCGVSECRSATVVITEHYSFAVPNAFTPNGDNLNDKFGIISPGTLPVFEFYIFNRWGQLVFESTDQNEEWDGSYNGNPSPQGVYIWKTKYQYRIEGRGSEIHEESGTVTLIR